MSNRNDEPATASEELASRTDDELYDILTHIDRRVVPERYVAARDEFARRHGATIRGQTLDDYFERARRSRPFAVRSTLKKKILVAIAIWSLAMLVLRAVMYLRAHK
jgi:hypothetical protein